MNIKVEINNVRLDKYLNEKLELSRSQITKMIQNGDILVNQNKVKSGYTLKENDNITMEEKKDDNTVYPEPMNLDIVYEDEDIIVVNKANGVVVHPAPGNYHNTLVNGLLYHAKNLSDVNGEFRPGIVHRIDAFTTGLLVIAKNNQAHQNLAKQLEEKTTHRKYEALVWGVIENDTGTIDAPIGRDKLDRKKMAVTENNAKDAITHFKVLERYKRATKIELQLETGRTHQIRVHMNYIGHPVVNDPNYGKRKTIDETGQCLHAKELGFIHPKTGEYMLFKSPLPQTFIQIMEQLKNE